MPLPEDLIRGLQQRTELPPGVVPGTRLTWLGPNSGDVAWTSEPDSQIRVGNGDPNGVVVAPMGTLYVEKDAPALWQNDDGLSSWTQIGTGGGGAIPFSYNDGTYTYSITDSGGDFVFQTLKNSTGDTSELHLDSGAFVSMFSDGNIEATPDLDWNLQAGRDWFMYAVDDGTINVGDDLTLFAGDEIALTSGGNTNITPSGYLLLNALTRFSNAVAPVTTGDMIASEFGFWLDDTPGATFLNIKAKDSSGTVRTASIPLT